MKIFLIPSMISWSIPTALISMYVWLYTSDIWYSLMLTFHQTYFTSAIDCYVNAPYVDGVGYDYSIDLTNYTNNGTIPRCFFALTTAGQMPQISTHRLWNFIFISNEIEKSRIRMRLGIPGILDSSPVLCGEPSPFRTQRRNALHRRFRDIQHFPSRDSENQKSYHCILCITTTTYRIL